MRFLMLVFILVILLTSCTSSPVQKPTEVITPENSSYPASGLIRSYPSYPAPNPGIEKPEILIPTVDSTLAIVKGQLLDKGKPVTNASLFLANLIRNEQGVVVVAQLDRGENPHTYTNEQGNFTFLNVQPETYALILDYGIEAFLLLDPKTSDQLRVVVGAVKEVDLGTLNYEEMPKAP